jgi:hypothetical protein
MPIMLHFDTSAAGGSAYVVRTKVGEVAAVDEDVCGREAEGIVQAVRVRDDYDALVAWFQRRGGGEGRADRKKVAANFTPAEGGEDGGGVRGWRCSGVAREATSPCAGEAGAYDFDEEERKKDDGNDGVDVAVAQSKTADQAHEPEK